MNDFIKFLPYDMSNVIHNGELTLITKIGNEHNNNNNNDNDDAVKTNCQFHRQMCSGILI